MKYIISPHVQFRLALKYIIKTYWHRKQKVLAAEAGISEPMISYVVTGKENISLSKQAAIAEAAGYSYENFIALGRMIHQEVPEEKLPKPALSNSMPQFSLLPSDSFASKEYEIIYLLFVNFSLDTMIIMMYIITMINNKTKEKKMKYEIIRGPKQKSRCKNVGTYGSPLYCDCGCQKPHNDDPKIDLAGVIVSGRANHGYADYTLTRDGKKCGEFNTQYCALVLDGYEYLGCDRDEMEPIRNQIFDGDTNKFARDQQESSQTGDTLAETAAVVHLAEKNELAEQDRQYANHAGYCNKCHSFCYGDCTAN